MPMTPMGERLPGRSRLRLLTVGGLLTLLSACGSDGVGPSAEQPAATAPAPADSAPADSTVTPPLDSTPPSPDSLPPPGGDSTATTGPSAASGGTAPGIVFASYNMQNQYLNSVHTGAGRGGITPDATPRMLAEARAKGARLVLKLSAGADRYVQNSDGTFSLTKWKSLVDRFKSIDLNSYIADGTILGHYLIDEPHRTAKWGGKVVSQATVEAMAKYSKQLWPKMTTFVRVVPSWLAQASIPYTYLDAGWAQYAARMGDPTKWVTPEVAIAKSKGLGLIVGMNVLDGGNGSSKIIGSSKGKYSMSASELRTYGSALLNQSYACGFFMWMHDVNYYGRSDIKSAMADLSARAKAHAKTSCQQ